MRFVFFVKIIELYKNAKFQEKLKPNAFRIDFHNGNRLHLCGYSHHDSAKWVADIRQEIETMKDAAEQDFEVVSGRKIMKIEKLKKNVRILKKLLKKISKNKICI